MKLGTNVGERMTRSGTCRYESLSTNQLEIWRKTKGIHDRREAANI
jgi:hypothetical protein